MREKLEGKDFAVREIGIETEILQKKMLEMEDRDVIWFSYFIFRGKRRMRLFNFCSAPSHVAMQREKKVILPRRGFS